MYDILLRFFYNFLVWSSADLFLSIRFFFGEFIPPNSIAVSNSFCILKSPVKAKIPQYMKMPNECYEDAETINSPAK